MTLIPQNKNNSWNNLITPEFTTELDRIENLLDQLPVHPQSGYRYFPDKNQIMRFLELDLNNINYVILGMDPYPSWYTLDNVNYPVATGRSFEVGNLDNWGQRFKQSSLCNILKAVYFNQYGEKLSMVDLRIRLDDDPELISPPHEMFNHWEIQGVMLLNATLTVLPGEPDSHTTLWYAIMTRVIRFINEHHDIGWLLFGKKAQNRIDEAIDGEYRSYSCCHPRLARFVDENVFAQVKDIRW